MRTALDWSIREVHLALASENETELERILMLDPRQLSETYFRAWKEHDWDALEAVLAPEVTFRGPLGTADGREACLQGLQGMSEMMTDAVVLQRFVEGDDSLTWFELHTMAAPPLPTANWQQTANGRITRIRVTFDPRPLFADPAAS